MKQSTIPQNHMASIGTKQIQLYCDQHDPRQFKCIEKTCGKAFGRKEHLARHIRIRRKPYFVIDLIIDTNEKPYKCYKENCGEGFTRSDTLKRYC
jgi:uncharacterized Zn-finger protein